MQDRAFIKLHKVSISREWLNTLFQAIILVKVIPEGMVEIETHFGRIIDLIV